MTFKYSKDNIDNLFKFFNETNVIASNKKKILRYDESNSKYKIYNCFIRNITYIILFTIIFILFYLYHTKINDHGLFVKIWDFVMIMYICILIFDTILKIIAYNKFKKSSFEGTITINNEGILDEDSKIKFLYKWDFIDYIIIGKYSINIILKDTKIYLRNPLNDKMIKQIKNINKNIKIIDLR